MLKQIQNYCAIPAFPLLHFSEKTLFSQDADDEFLQSLHLRQDAELLVRKRFFVQAGTESEAKDYYARISKSEYLNFDFLPNSNLNDLLVYMGSAKRTETGQIGLLAADLESLPSFLLMPGSEEFTELESEIATNDPDRNGLDGVLNQAAFKNKQVLVSRFYAPKITTYFCVDDPKTIEREDEVPIERDDIQPINGAGWRKLVKLKPQARSIAYTAKVKQAYIFFNFKKKDATADPFQGNRLGNNLVIIVPKDQKKADSAYFAVYQSGDLTGYKVGLALQADFDLPNQTKSSVQYYVPRACAECHGHSSSILEANLDIWELRGEPLDDRGRKTTDFKSGIYAHAKPNYLDTDQWYDWMDFDYRQATSSLNDVLFDGSKDHGSSNYNQAFDVIRAINEEIETETYNAERGGHKSFQTLSIEKWNRPHKTDNSRKPYSVRSIGLETWSKNSAKETRLLQLLDNHCFRCHSSVRFNVFDKASFRKERKGVTRKFLATTLPSTQNSAAVGYIMPQGRVLREEERIEVLRLFIEVFGR
jgi:hypothetical protein